MSGRLNRLRPLDLEAPKEPSKSEGKSGSREDPLHSSSRLFTPTHAEAKKAASPFEETLDKEGTDGVKADDTIVANSGVSFVAEAKC